MLLLIILIGTPIYAQAPKQTLKTDINKTLANIENVILPTPPTPLPEFPKGNPAPKYVPPVIKVAYVAPTQVTAVDRTLEQWLLDLRNCESGGDYTKNTGNGYYGAYQFTIATWNHWETGYARADLAPAAVQDATIILNTNSTMGLVTQNPGCYHKLGLSNKPPAL